MEVNINQAVKYFFSNSSFDMVYIEAVANALDAQASKIEISVNLPDKKQLINLNLRIKDNGVGFDDVRFSKFSKLLDVEEKTHKGLGRLVYLTYFDSIRVNSIYENTHKRAFEFSNTFDGRCEVSDISDSSNGAELTMCGFRGKRLHDNSFINPFYIKRILLENFYLRLYKNKLEGRNITISVNSNIDGSFAEAIINTDDIPDFKTIEVDYRRDLFSDMKLYYYIQKVEPEKRSIITALAIDDRTKVVDIIAEENLPHDYEMIFLLLSRSFEGITDGSRENISISDADFGIIKKVFREEIAKIICAELPSIKESNEQKKAHLERTYPHLVGYFESSDIGFSSQSEILNKAQTDFFRDQREILGATSLTDGQYEKSLDLSARALAEYILFRQRLIEKLKKIDETNPESDIHNLLVPMKQKLNADDFEKNLYRNNVWVLDDKFMSFQTILSDLEMTKVIDVLTNGDVREKNADRPDLVLYFSDDPNDKGKKVDVVIVELKKLGLKTELVSDVDVQLDTRARSLSKYYDNRIQRVWYYGVVDLSGEYAMYLKSNGFKPLFSKGAMYYKQKQIYTNPETEDYVIANTYILDYKAMVNDADVRNATFLEILKRGIKKES